ncbi:MAG: selenide, water dikinase SelD [Cyclobacteriaceae bacterium]|nr:selenide, water dikinase SelD [Cyclobacteriaceae bacterium]
MNEYKLTQYSHGAGCGCKISPSVLEKIINRDAVTTTFPSLLVGNEHKDDAAVYDLDGKTAIISTTDFFMPIVDDPHDFGAIAATNAISDIYAMGGTPIMAIAILGWPIDKLPIEVAGQVLEGGREICRQAGIPLAGGHSIDAPEPIFGLAVTGRIPVADVKKNADARPGDLLYLTKPLGIGLVTTAQKRGQAEPADLLKARNSMITLNKVGQSLASFDGVHAITDVTGFGLGGHLVEMCEASGVSAILSMTEIPRFEFVDKYIGLDCIPGGTVRNWKSYGHQFKLKNENDFKLIADPQTSGGLLVSVAPDKQATFEAFMKNEGLVLDPIGSLRLPAHTSHLVEIC